MHKVRATVKFESIEAYQDMKNALDHAGLKFDAFVTTCVNDTWNRMLNEYQQLLKAQQDAYTSSQADGNSESVQMGESTSSEESSAGDSDILEEGGVAASEG